MASGALETRKSPTADQYIATEVILEDGKNKNIQRVLINDKDGAAFSSTNPLPVDKAGLATDAKLNELKAQLPPQLVDGRLPVIVDGRAADDTEAQAGAVGTIGWLSSIFVMVKRITAQLPTSLGAKTSENSLSITPATDSTFNVASADKVGYLSAFTIVPTTTLAAGTTYLSIYNGGSTPAKFRDFRIVQQFRGTAAATSSDFEIVPYTHTATSTGGTLVPSDIVRLTNPALDVTSLLSIRASNIGGIISGGVQSAKKLIFGSNNQLGIDYEFSLNENLFPVTIQPGTGLLLKANSIIVAGTVLRVQMLWEE
jgi:hypothetical protein